ncbi:hypothetical protein SAY86_003769 [Trapa natans]|uniref:DCD domain-containing protein n=1 Tax=Trapa natans TaxID=22666 RepID=A0AAN7MER5_TRANT|nr:hypothetical protein SAY86_003769 [Trapa natans]
MENNQQSFWQFSDQLRLHTSNMANLSLNDPIWANNFAIKRPDDRRNFDVRVGGSVNSSSASKVKASDLNLPGMNDPVPAKDFNGFNFGWKMGTDAAPAVNDLNLNKFDNGWKVGLGSPMMNVGNNDVFNKGIYSKPVNMNHQMNANLNFKSSRNNKAENDYKGTTKKNGSKKIGDSNNNGNREGKSGADKQRFKTLPPSESLPRNETVGGYIFVCNNDTMQENLQRQLFGLPPRYRDSVRQITPGLPLFLYNYSTHQLHGVFEAASFGGANIDPSAWEDKKCPGESRFPAQVRVITRKVCEPLEEDSFRPILHHYDGPKFRLELNIPETLSLLDILSEQEN